MLAASSAETTAMAMLSSIGLRQPIAMKIVYNDEIRRFPIPASPSVEQLRQQVITAFEIASRVRLRYKVTPPPPSLIPAPHSYKPVPAKDDESDMCTICTDDELLEAIRVAALASPPVLRVQVELEGPLPLNYEPARLQDTSKVRRASQRYFRCALLIQPVRACGPCVPMCARRSARRTAPTTQRRIIPLKSLLRYLQAAPSAPSIVSIVIALRLVRALSRQRMTSLPC